MGLWGTRHAVVRREIRRPLANVEPNRRGSWNPSEPGESTRLAVRASACNELDAAEEFMPKSGCPALSMIQGSPSRPGPQSARISAHSARQEAAFIESDTAGEFAGVARGPGFHLPRELILPRLRLIGGR